jgi:hypothetical protein
MRTMSSAPLVNTSLPAREAPTLVPATLATITSSGSSVTPSVRNTNLEKVSIYKGNDKKVNLVDDDFPSLGGKPKTSAVKPSEKPALNFVAMSRQWAEKQKEEARIAAEEAEKERMRLQLERMTREKEEKEEKIYKKQMISLASIKKTKENEAELRNDYVNDDYTEEEEPYESPLDEDEEDEEEDDEFNSQWDGRRYRDEL